MRVVGFYFYSYSGFRLGFVAILLIYFTGSSDPYVKVKIGDKLHYKSKTIYRDLNPVWDESFVLPINDLTHQIVFKVTL